MLGLTSMDAYREVAALASGLSEVGWAVVSALAVASVLALLVWAKKSTKKAFLSWFSQAIDLHVEPKFAEVRENTQRTGDQLKQQASDAAAAVKEELRIHTQEEGEIVRAVVQQEMVPVMAAIAATQSQLTEHMGRDEEFAKRVGADLRAGQQALLRTLTRNQDVQLEEKNRANESE